MEDREIIGLFFERDETALREISLKYGTYCKTIARNILNNAEDADECVNDTYMRAWESIPPKKPSVLGAYLGRITRNIALNRVRFFGTEKRGSGDEALSFDELDEFLSGEYSVEIEAERGEFISAVNAFLESLPARQRQLFIGRFWGCRNIAELAKKHGMSQSGVSENLARTLKKLKKHLKKGGYEL